MALALQPYTLERCYAFWKEYVADPDMMDSSYTYDPAWVELITTKNVSKQIVSTSPSVWRRRSSVKSS